MALFDPDFIPKHENVIFLDPLGVGKTHLAIALAIKAGYHGFKVYFTTMAQRVMRKLKESRSKHKAYLTSPLVMVDEVFFLLIDSWEGYLFFQFVSHRYEKSSTLITSNKSFGEWQELFGGQVIDTAIHPRPTPPSLQGHQHQRPQLQPQRPCLHQNSNQQTTNYRGHNPITRSLNNGHQVVHFYISIDNTADRGLLLGLIMEINTSRIMSKTKSNSGGPFQASLSFQNVTLMRS